MSERTPPVLRAPPPRFRPGSPPAPRACAPPTSPSTPRRHRRASLAAPTPRTSTCWSIPSCASRPTRSTTCTCSRALLDAAEAAVAEIAAASAGLSPVLLIGAPLRHNGRLYNCALAIAGGKLLGAVPKSYLPNYREFYEKRWFAIGDQCQGPDHSRRRRRRSPSASTSIFASDQLPGFRLRGRDLRGLLGPQPALHHGRARRRHDPRQSLGLEHRHRQGRRPPHAMPRAVGPNRQRLPLFRRRPRREHHRHGVGRPRHDLRARRPPRRRRALQPRPELCMADIDTDRILGDRSASPLSTMPPKPPVAPRTRFRTIALRPPPARGRHRPRPPGPPLPVRPQPPSTSSTPTATRRSTSRSTA